MALHHFIDFDAPDKPLFLVIDETPAGEHGVEHPGCTDLASVRPDLDRFMCTTCKFEGRIDGGWVQELWHAEATYVGGA